MSQPSGNRETAVIESYHARTKHTEARLRQSAPELDWANQPLPLKLYRHLEAVPLPRDRETLAAPTPPALEAIAASARPQAATGKLDLAALAQVLFLAAGIIKVKQTRGGDVYFRAHSNTGALYHLDLYVVTAPLEDLDAGVYQFGPQDLALHRLRKGDYRGHLAAASGSHSRVAEAPVVLASASTYWRNAWKYRERAWRHCFWDAGTLHANLLAIAGARGLAPAVVAGFVDAAVERLLGLDARREGALTLVPLGRGEGAPGVEEPPASLAPATEPLSAAEVDYPLIRDAQAASRLVSAAEVTAWRQQAAPEPGSLAGGSRLISLQPLAAVQLSAASLDRVIRRRGSTRAFDPARALSFEALSTALDHAAAGIPADFLAGSDDSLVTLYLMVHAVEGLAPGRYVVHREHRALELLEAGEVRAASARLALFQALAGDAAVNVYALADLARVLERFGNRGYRAAQLEGGLIGGRLYLAAYAQGFGATGLTFLDDEVPEFFGPRAAGLSPMFLTALGYPRRGA